VRPFEPITVESAPKQIARRIKDAILLGEIKIDDRLPTEDELAGNFNVSRATIREALKRLAAENLVVSKRGATGGNFVRAPSQADIRQSIGELITVAVSLEQFTFEQVMGCRFEIGLMCCRLASENRTDADLEAMRREVVLQRSADITDVEFCASDVRLHCLIAAATGNSLLAASASGILEGIEPITNLVLFRVRDRNIIADQHWQLIECLANRDHVGAGAILTQQVEYLSKKHVEVENWRKENYK